MIWSSTFVNLRFKLIHLESSSQLPDAPTIKQRGITSLPGHVLRHDV